MRPVERNIFCVRCHVADDQACRVLEYDILARIVALSAEHAEEGLVFVLAGNFMVKAAAYLAWHVASVRAKDSFIDVGSSLDAYAGVRSRDYNQDLQRFCHEALEWFAHDVCLRECEPFIGSRQCSKVVDMTLEEQRRRGTGDGIPARCASTRKQMFEKRGL